jgi:hypothetical protein
MRFPTWLRLLEGYLHPAVPVDGVYLRGSLPEELPCGPRRRSYRLAENGLKQAAFSGGNNKWINVR